MFRDIWFFELGLDHDSSDSWNKKVLIWAYLCYIVIYGINYDYVKLGDHFESNYS